MRAVHHDVARRPMSVDRRVPASASRPRVVFLTDIVTPYMVAVLDALAQRVDLTAVFCAHSGTRGAEWSFAAPFPFRHRVLRGPTIHRRPPDGRNGFVADPEDTRAWVRALVALARDPGLRRRLAMRAHGSTLERTPERAAEGYADAVRAALGTDRRGGAGRRIGG